ncbi:MAG TPA: DsbA family protein [Terriglobales bacterium]|nr:DsbA family protein [Terriglobales bacterium]
MKRIADIVVLAACIVAVGCGTGSPTNNQQSSVPSQSTGKVNVATGSHILGNTDAKVTIIEFGDFQCPYCKMFHTDTESQIFATYVSTGKAKFAYRQFPLVMHQNAGIAAEASECAAKVGGNEAFWNYHDMLFAKGDSSGAGLEVASLKQYAIDLQLDMAAFNSCLDNHETRAIVSKDYADGQAAGVQGVPAFFINGKPLDGAKPFSAFQTMIDAEL